MTSEQVQSLLDDRTVLLNYYLGAAPGGGLGVFILALTRDEMTGAAGRGGFPSALITMKHGGRTIVGSPFGVTVQALLEGITAEPGAALVSDKAAATLAGDPDVYLGSLKGFLAKQRAAGKDHLCIVPHGPLHYYPFHLMGLPGRPLAAEWITTYLPNLQLLNTHARSGGARAGAHAGPPRVLAAVGLSFAGGQPHDQPRLPQAADESKAIAKLFHVEPILDAAATEAAVVDAIQQARYVHLATHGAHNFAAPAFQRLYLTPDRDTDGIVHAFEVSALDLSGVELLTLSACETALGRFDVADNLHGLPAAFLLAGVATIVGTLWEIETNAAATFFTRLYAELSRGATRLDAFAAAQRATRVTHPQYRDWGAFYLMGAWS